MKQREARQTVAFNVRIRDDSGWGDAWIRNLSSRGVMVEMENVPPKGAFLELRRGNVVIVGQVRWSEKGRCGLRTQDRISIAALKAAYDKTGPVKQDDGVVFERRAAVRVLTPAEIAERSRQRGAQMQWGLLAAAVVSAAVLIASFVLDLLQKPMAIIAAHLG